MQVPVTTLVTSFSDIEDFRIDRNKRHMLVDIVVLAVCCTICGANGFVEIATVAKEKIDWFKTFLALPNGIPSHDTFGRVFARLDPQKLEECFLTWISATFHGIQPQQIALDGKQSRHSADPTNDVPALQMISAWATDTGLVLGQRAVDPESNEITALPTLLETVDIQGCDITADALHCQKTTVKTIATQGGAYTIGVKENQPQLYTDIVTTFAHLHQNAPHLLDMHTTCEKGHGRIETRRYWVTDQLDQLRNRDEWSNLHSIGMVESERRVNGKVTCETRYYISSRTPEAKLFGQRVRSHWRIENSLHWVLDVVMREDDSRIRKDHAPENMAVLRHIAINLLKQEKSHTGGVQSKRLRAACNNDYLGKVIRMPGK